MGGLLLTGAPALASLRRSSSPGRPGSTGRPLPRITGTSPAPLWPVRNPAGLPRAAAAAWLGNAGGGPVADPRLDAMALGSVLPGGPSARRDHGPRRRTEVPAASRGGPMEPRRAVTGALRPTPAGEVLRDVGRDRQDEDNALVVRSSHAENRFTRRYGECSRFGIRNRSGSSTCHDQVPGRIRALGVCRRIQLRAVTRGAPGPGPSTRAPATGRCGRSRRAR